jgi:hypothetical protein
VRAGFSRTAAPESDVPLASDPLQLLSMLQLPPAASSTNTSETNPSTGSPPHQPTVHFPAIRSHPSAHKRSNHDHHLTPQATAQLEATQRART